MRVLLPPSHHLGRVQHHVGPHDALHPSSDPDQSPPPTETQDRPLRRLLARGASDPVGHPQPVLQLHRTLRIPRLPGLVHGRGGDLGLRGQRAASLAIAITALRTRGVQQPSANDGQLIRQWQFEWERVLPQRQWQPQERSGKTV